MSSGSPAFGVQPETIQRAAKRLANPTLERRPQRLFDEPLRDVVDAPQRGGDCRAQLALHELTRQRQILGDALLVEAHERPEIFEQRRLLEWRELAVSSRPRRARAGRPLRTTCGSSRGCRRSRIPTTSSHRASSSECSQTAAAHAARLRFSTALALVADRNVPQRRRRHRRPRSAAATAPARCCLRRIACRLSRAACCSA